MVAAGLPYSTGQIFDATDANFCAGFGDGTDGAFNETASATTDLVQGTVYQYTSFALGADHTISAASASTKPIIILVSGDCTINGTIDLAGLGATTGYHSYFGSIGTNGGVQTNHGVGGLAGLPSWNFGQKGFIINGTKGGNGGGTGNYQSGAGGGGGASMSANGSDGASGGEDDTSGTPGTGGAGGCTIFIKVGGTLTFGASSSIDCSGVNGTAASGGNDGGGGGGGAGDVIIIHKGAKTDNGVTTDVTAGSGGAAAGSGGAGGAGGAGTENILDWSAVLF